MITFLNRKGLYLKFVDSQYVENDDFLTIKPPLQSDKKRFLPPMDKAFQFGARALVQQALPALKGALLSGFLPKMPNPKPDFKPYRYIHLKPHHPPYKHVNYLLGKSPFPPNFQVAQTDWPNNEQWNNGSSKEYK